MTPNDHGNGSEAHGAPGGAHGVAGKMGIAGRTAAV